MENIGPHLIKELAEVFVGPRHFSELDHAVFNANAVLIIQKIKSESTNVAMAIEVDWLKLILEDSHNFLL